jgi:hypothetical protein
MRPLVRLLARVSWRVREALVVAEIEIGFGAVVGDENLAVLERAHGAGIHVQVGVELLQRDASGRGFPADNRSRPPRCLSQGRNHAAGDEDIFSHALLPAHFAFFENLPTRAPDPGRIHAQRFVIRFHHANSESVFQRPQLFQRFACSSGPTGRSE